MDTQVDIENLVLRYLAGETTDQEAQQMQEWLRANKANRRLFAQHKKLWLGSKLLSGHVADQLVQDRKKVDLKIQNSELQRNLDRANRWIRRLAYAASITLLLGVASLLYLLHSETSAKQEISMVGGEIVVPYGSKSMMTLPDGSKVWVNAGSSVSYPADFGVSSRNVNLTGEAYFDVVKMEDVPFYVNTDVIKVKVYGTTFNVKAYSDEQMVETTLERGAITIIRNDAPEQEISVAPNQKITIMRDSAKPPVLSASDATDATNATNATSAANTPNVAHTAKALKPIENFEMQDVKSTETITAWKDNRLVFDQEPLRSVAKKLERRYNVQFRFGNEKIKGIRYTAVIKEMPIDQVLEAISLTSPIHYTIKGTEVTLVENKNFMLK